MRPLEVVELAPGIERSLGLGKAAEAAQREQLGLERAVEALVLAAALRMVGPGVDEPDLELGQPDPQLGPAGALAVAPRPAIVDEQRLGQPMAAEESAPDRPAPSPRARRRRPPAPDR